MESTINQPFEQIPEIVETMPLDDQEWLITLLEKRYSEKRRADIAANVRQTLKEHKQGLTRTGTVEKLLMDLDDESDLGQ